ncbi:hypothetical protein O6H91_08G001600 [Diphasiastrum complanatum]|uniref:Uncharacterized protein n=1 Tax=Diphasiastrum complanatum TaxID=34168 RepID=A0ACC2CUJ7_DIPCM|nr:hypothetical protein O6H91_08G001600 [Diphasiastrum complanatum]
MCSVSERATMALMYGSYLRLSSCKIRYLCKYVSVFWIYAVLVESILDWPKNSISQRQPLFVLLGCSQSQLKCGIKFLCNILYLISGMYNLRWSSINSIGCR